MIDFTVYLWLVAYFASIIQFAQTQRWAVKSHWNKTRFGCGLRLFTGQMGSCHRLGAYETDEDKVEMYAASSMDSEQKLIQVIREMCREIQKLELENMGLRRRAGAYLRKNAMIPILATECTSRLMFVCFLCINTPVYKILCAVFPENDYGYTMSLLVCKTSVCDNQL